jgi:hypothetical protein
LVRASSPLQHVLTRAEQAFSLSSALSLLSPAAICSTNSCCVPAAMVRLRLSCCIRQDAPPRWENRETAGAGGGAVDAAGQGVTALQSSGMMWLTAKTCAAVNYGGIGRQKGVEAGARGAAGHGCSVGGSGGGGGRFLLREMVEKSHALVVLQHMLLVMPQQHVFIQNGRRRPGRFSEGGVEGHSRVVSRTNEAANQ